ncbi:MAG: hypothetical protein DDT25_01079 [Chloroflexi bacterium]|nr:hypothetical protein [Chloroflexota bacterium]
MESTHHHEVILPIGRGGGFGHIGSIYPDGNRPCGDRHIIQIRRAHEDSRRYRLGEGRGGQEQQGDHCQHGN